MPDNNPYQRFIDGTAAPTEKKMRKAMGTRIENAWTKLRKFLEANYDFQPELTFDGSKYGWCYRYRKSGKTLCVLFPETKAFTVQVVLGKKEIALVKERFSRFNKETQRVFDNAYQYHDGKWLYRRILNISDLNDVLSLITIKRKPKK